nr:RNA-directed DNA polymerase, eukaryota, reverse transcriptase zinc-binding domain protein [Tanacetum cinerariifolium]
MYCLERSCSRKQSLSATFPSLLSTMTSSKGITKMASSQSWQPTLWQQGKPLTPSLHSTLLNNFPFLEIVGSKLRESFLPIRSGREESELNDLQHEISSIIPSSNPDSWRWSLHPSGQFSVSAFRAIIDSKLLGHLGSKLRWNNLVPGKINILAWRIRNYRLPTRANIDKRGIDIHSILCPFCEEQIEDEDHIFALCPFSRNIWDLIRKWWGLDVIPLDTALNVLEMADDGDLNFGEEISSLFDVVVLCAIWWIWRARNLLVFQAVKVNMINIIDDIIATSYLWIKNRAKCCSISWVNWCCNPSTMCILLKLFLDLSMLASY